MVTQKNDTLVQLDPAKVRAENNARFSLLPHRIDAMAESIVALGGVMVPVEVQKLAKPDNGYTHDLVAGFYRHAGTLKLNKESGAGLTLPALVREPVDETDRLTRQVHENTDRENLSPMDRAVAISKMEAAGVSRETVCKVFAVPGGRKGLTMQPASNSTINMHLSFLELPKAIQAKIHDGRIGVAAAHELTRVPAEQREAILAKAEALRLKAIDRDEREAEKDASQAEKAGAAEAKLAAVTEALDVAEKARIAAIEAHKAATQALKAAKVTPPNFLDLAKEEQTIIAERIGAAKTDLRAAEKQVSKTGIALDKAQRAHRAVADPEPKAAAEAKAKPAGTKKAAVGPQDVKQAAAEAGVKGTKPVALNAADARAAAAQLGKSRLAKVKAIGVIFGKVLSGELTPARAETELSLITGERVTKKA